MSNKGTEKKIFTFRGFAGRRIERAARYCSVRNDLSPWSRRFSWQKASDRDSKRERGDVTGEQERGVIKRGGGGIGRSGKRSGSK